MKVKIMDVFKDSERYIEKLNRMLENEKFHGEFMRSNGKEFSSKKDAELAYTLLRKQADVSYKKFYKLFHAFISVLEKKAEELNK